MPYFTGGSTFQTTGYYNTGFVENGHTVFLRGLGGSNPNPYAVIAAGRVADQFFNQPSTNTNSAYSRLLHYLWTIQQKEAEKEQAYLTMKIEKLRSSLAPDFYDLIKRSFDEGNLSATYTLIMKSQMDLEQLKKELSSSNFRSFQQDSSVWKNNFGKFIETELVKRLENTGDMIKVIEGAPDVSIASLIEDYINNILNADVKNYLIPEIEDIKKKYQEQLTKAFYNAGIIDAENWDAAAPLFADTEKDYRGLSKKSELTYQSRTLGKSQNYALNTLIKGIASQVMKGIAGELSNINISANLGVFSLHTGNVTKSITDIYTGESSTVAIKGDLLSIEVARGDIDIKSIAENAVEAVLPDENKIKAVERAIEQSLEDMDIFEVSTNIKTYTSKRNLKIEEEGKFSNRLSNLKNVIAESQGIPSNSFEKLIFLLNNTVSGCIASGRKDEIGDYIAAIYSAWMWDDYTDMFSVEAKSANRVKKIHIFNSGGAYFTASEMMSQLISNLESIHSSGTNAANQFVKVDITAPTYDVSEYNMLVETYPLEDKHTYAEKQAQLGKRWNAVTAAVISRGKIAVHIKQQDLEQLLGNLRDLILNS